MRAPWGPIYWALHPPITPKVRPSPASQPSRCIGPYHHEPTIIEKMQGIPFKESQVWLWGGVMLLPIRYCFGKLVEGREPVSLSYLLQWRNWLVWRDLNSRHPAPKGGSVLKTGILGNWVFARFSKNIKHLTFAGCHSEIPFNFSQLLSIPFESEVLLPICYQIFDDVLGKCQGVFYSRYPTGGQSDSMSRHKFD